ncbi:hypothetical protein PENSPDRAFT_293280 [Peniophora sp. CONT]|nr:hypothetical protein PENSPDRAFT_293280 [Peniophora sp. CONT]
MNSHTIRNVFKCHLNCAHDSHTAIAFSDSFTPAQSDTSSTTCTTGIASDSLALSHHTGSKPSPRSDPGKLVGVMISDKGIEQEVRKYGLEAVEAYRNVVSTSTNDPFAPLWTADNWRCWLDSGKFVIWLAMKQQQLVHGYACEYRGPSPEALEYVLNASSTSLPIDWRFGRPSMDEESEACWPGCAWSGCERYCKEVVGMRLSACKGCGQVRYCGRECQRSDWTNGGHKARCRRLK